MQRVGRRRIGGRGPRGVTRGQVAAARGVMIDVLGLRE